MNRLSIIFIGFMLTFASAWLGLAVIPSRHYQASATSVDQEIDRGRGVYMQNGCIYCHSQQVSPRNFRSDQDRGWGSRRTVASDYQNDKIALLGTMRTGPDLANIGARNPSQQWHYVHLYKPQFISKGSIMPPFPFLFERRKAGSGPAAGAIALGDGDEIIPSPEAKALVAYLLSLKHNIGEPPDAFEPPARQ
ncbi:MAG: cbb3-type cytochrome c oxidase subunit II [Chthoniobacteraceae bacterium]